MPFLCRHWSVGLAILACLVVAQPARAVPPPDFIINVGSQMAQFFSLALLFLTAIFSSVNQFLHIRFGSARVKRGYWIGGLVLIVVVSGIGARVFGAILEQRALAKLTLSPEKKIEEVLPERPIDQGSKDLDRALVPTSTVMPEAPVLLSADQPADAVSSTIKIAKDATLPFKLSNDRLKTLLQQPTIPFLVLDARENIEHEYGNFPDSIHIRYADLKAGRWAELPVDRAIIVLCWSGIRGSRVASFLQEKKLMASYLADGASGWVAAGGVWEGSVLFSDRFPEERYKLAFSKEDMTRRVQGGALLIDAREPADRAKHAFANATPISLLATPSTELEALLQSVPAGKSVITVCSAYVDCFEAKLVGVELERKGHPFLGRYVYAP